MKRAKKLFEKITAKKFPNVGSETDIQVQKAQKVPKKVNSRKFTPGHIIIKMSKIKQTLKSSKRKATNYVQENFHKTITDFSAETSHAGQKGVA